MKKYRSKSHDLSVRKTSVDASDFPPCKNCGSEPTADGLFPPAIISNGVRKIRISCVRCAVTTPIRRTIAEALEDWREGRFARTDEVFGP